MESAGPACHRSRCSIAPAVRKDEHGKPLYLPILQFTDQATQAAFSQRVVASLLEFAPAAFDDEEAA
jgi:hypothetical protein